MIRLLIGLVLAATAAIANAALPYSPEFAWTAPTTNTDGTAIPATGTLALKEYRFYCAVPPAVPSKATTPKVVIAAPTQAWLPASGTFATGNWSCAVSAVNNGPAGANESVLTNPVNFTIAAPVPAPPSVLTVQ